MKIIPAAGILITLSLVTGCKSMPVLDQLQGKDCPAEYKAKPGYFYAIGSAANLEQAKLNARKDLASQISSDITSRMERQVQDRNGRIQRSASDYVKSESSAIPMDQHAIEAVCETGGQFYARASLSHTALIQSTGQRLDANLKIIRQQLKRGSHASLYEKYQARNALENKLAQSRAYQAILQQYAGKPPSDSQQTLLTQAERFMEANRRLHLGVTADDSLNPLLPLLEEALSKAQLPYHKGSRKAAAVVSIQGDLHRQTSHGRYVVQLQARLRVKRGDTGALLSEKDLGQVTTVSTAGYETAMRNAQRQMQLRLKQYLAGTPQQIKQRLGLDKT